MGSVLTKQDRETIVFRAVKQAFEAREKKMLEAEYALTTKVHASLYPKDKIKLAQQLGTAWVSTVYHSGFYFCTNGQRHCFRSDPNKALYVPLSGSREEHLLDEALISQVDVLENYKEDLKNEKEQAKNKLNSLLLSLNTAKRLLDNWPEGKPFYADLIQEEVKSGLPAIRITEVNDIFGLNKVEPKGKKHA